jgi:alpha-L-arabinofuranosidase
MLNGGASLSDILSAIKNIAQNINSLGQIFTEQDGHITTATVTAQTLVVAGQGRLVSVSVTVAGAAAGTINNSATTGGAAASNVLVAVPNAVGIIQCGQKFTYGLVISPGAGQSLNVTYYQT